jgi:L-asparaginase
MRWALPLVAALAVLLTPLDLRASAVGARKPDAPPRVHVIATGGTIANRAGGRLTADDLVASIPSIDRWAHVTTEQFANVASGALTLEQWLRLARSINERFRGDPFLAGIVVTSGTDTLEETAYFLHLTVRDERPVVVVGSMRTPSTLGYEGAANLLQAIRVAADPTSRGKGALVVLNDEINSAREVIKSDALRLHTFQSRAYGVLGVVDADRVAYYRKSTKRHTEASEFDVERIDELPRVDIIMVYQGAPGDLIAAAVERGSRGLVIASAGAGALSGTQGQAVMRAADEGVVVAMSSRTGGGRIAPRDGHPDPLAEATDGQGQSGPPPAAARRRLIAAEDLSPVKARILLMLALATTEDKAEIQRIFEEY